METYSGDASGANLLTISIAHQDNLPGRPARRLHKLGVDVPFHDVKPPSGVLMQALEVVHIAMNVSRTRTRKRRKVKGCLNPGDVILPHSSQDSTPNVECRWPDEETAFEPDVMEFADTQPNEAEVEPEIDDTLLDMLETHRSQYETVSPHDTELACAEDKPDAADKPAKLRKRPPSMTEQGLEPEAGEETQAECLLQLVDAAVRLAITEAPRRLGNGMRVNDVGSFKRLESVAPSLWSPGYLEAISSRAVFLPTISHAFSNVACTHAKSASLRPKLARLDGAQSAQNGMSIRLWRLLQSGLYKEEAARSLSPLFGAGIAPLATGEDGTFDFLDTTTGRDDSYDNDMDDSVAEADNTEDHETFEDDLLDSIY